eukprot:scpid12043/ scgid25586/ 
MASSVGADLYKQLSPDDVDVEQEFWYHTVLALARYGFISDGLAQYVSDVLSNNREARRQAGEQSSRPATPSDASLFVAIMEHYRPYAITPFPTSSPPASAMGHVERRST